MILPFRCPHRGRATTRSELGGRRGAGNRMFCSQKNADSDLSAERPRPLSVVEGPSIELRVPHVPREGPRVELLMSRCAEQLSLVKKGCPLDRLHLAGSPPMSAGDPPPEMGVQYRYVSRVCPGSPRCLFTGMT